MSNDLKIQGVVEVSTEGAEGALNRVGSAAENMSRKVEASANQAGKAVDSIGAGAGQVAEEFTRNEGKIVSAIKRATAQMEQMGKTASQKLEMKISTQGLDAAKFEPMLAKLRELEAAQVRVGTGSRGMGGNLQNASYQMQDFIVQVNGGVDATKALAMQLPQVLVGFGAAGAAIGVLAALLPNIITLFKDSADSSKTFKDAMSDFDKAIGDVGSTVKTFDLDPLFKQFNDSSDAVKAATIEQVRFQQEYIKTTQLVANKKFGESISGLVVDTDWERFLKSFRAGGGGTKLFYDQTPGTKFLAEDLGIQSTLAEKLYPALQNLEKGAVSVNSVFDEFGRKLLAGNGKAVDLAKSLADMAKSERDADAATKALTDAQDRMAKGHVQTKKEADDAAKAQKAAVKSAEELQSLLDTINGKSSDFDSNYVKNVQTLLKAYDSGKLSLGEYNAVFARYLAMQPGAVDAAKELAKAEKEAEKSRQEYMRGIADETTKLLEKAKASEQELATIGLSADELGRLTEQRYNEQIAIKQAEVDRLRDIDGRESEVYLIEQQIDALQRLKSAEIVKPKLREQAREWEKFTDDINRSLTDALYRAFESGDSFGKAFATNLENTFKAMLLKFAIQAAMTTGGNALNSVINLVAGTSGANGGAGTNYFGLASNASSIYNLASGAYSNYAMLGYQWATGSMSAANALGTLYANATTTGQYTALDALLATNGAYGTAGAGTGAAAGSAGAGAAAGETGVSASGLSTGTVAWVAAIIMGMYMSSEAWKSGVRWEDSYAKDARKEWWYGMDSLAVNRDLMDAPAKAIFGEDFVNSQFYAIATGSSLSAQIHKAVQNAIFGGQWQASGTPRFTGSFNEAMNGMTSGTYLQDYSKSGGWFGSSKSTTESQQISSEFDDFLDKMYQGIKKNFVEIGKLFDDNDLVNKLVGFAYRVEIADATNMQAAVNTMANQLTEAMGRVLFPSIDALNKAASGETWAQTFGRVVNEVGAVNAMFEKLGHTLVEQFGKNNADRVLKLADSLVTLMGGLDKMQTTLANYYAGYYSQSERSTLERDAMAKQFEALGLTMPKTRSEFRRLVESMDLATESGQKTYASLLSMATAFGVVADSMASAVDEVANTIETALSGLFDALLQQIQDARTGVANAKDTVNGIGAMSPAQISAAIAAATPASPNGSNILATQQALTQAKLSSDTTLAAAIAARDAEQAAVNERNKGWAVRLGGMNVGGWAYNGGEQVSEYQSLVSMLSNMGVLSAANLEYSSGRDSSAAFGLKDGYQFLLDGAPIGQNLQLAHAKDWIYANGVTWGRYNRDLGVYNYKPYGTEVIDPKYDAAVAKARSDGAAAVTAAEDAAIQAQIDYSNALKQYVVDASKAVDKLNNLRDETLRYYETQKQLADLMLSSASNLREAMRQARMSQLSESEQLTQTRNVFDMAYTMALSTTGATQAGYADKMAATLPQLVTMLEQQATSSTDWQRMTGVLFAQSDNIATMLEQQAAVDYQSESLALLNAIDATLTIIENTSSSAEKIISDAVYETGKTTADGLRAVIAAIKGDPIPAFARGGTFDGGWRIVGENGPELEATGPARIFNADQTRSIFSTGTGGSEELVAEIRALREENRAQASAIASLQNRLVKIHERWDGAGLPEQRVTA